MAVDLRVLGNVEVWVDGRQVEIGHARQRCVLAVLLVGAGNVVTVDQLIDRVWADRPPHQARPVLRGYLSRLRRALAGTGLSIERRHGGYLLVVDPDAVDARHFRRLVAQARAETDVRRALATLDTALALWRGEACTGLDTPWINAVREGLARERFAAETQRIDLALDQGHHTALLAELCTRAGLHPLDEHLAGQLMLALYRCGRPAQALDHYQRLRLRLSEELGTDPSPPLRELHRRILTGDPALTRLRPASLSRSAPVPRQLPRQLPPPPPSFTGRTAELAELDMAVKTGTEAVVISAIGGIGGVGKTWLALHWAHRHADRFPDGQLYVNLRGFDPAAPPTPTAVALRGFLDALGVAPAGIPVGLDAQVGLYRSLIVGKRMLILLDNARDTDQVLPLLPGTPTCAIIVTSRQQLGGLVAAHAAIPLQLDVLGPTEARELLTARLGADRVAAEPDAVTELLDHCAGLPLAIGILAARAALRPAWPLGALAEQLRDAATRLDALDAGELAVNLRAVFSCSTHTLDDDTAGLFGLLGLAPGPDISLPATASLVALTTRQARVLQHNLERAHLVQQQRPGRYRMHDLVRLYAADQNLPTDQEAAALRRLIDHYTHTALAGEGLLDPHRASLVRDLAPDPPAPGSRPHPLPDKATTLEWFQAEHPNLLAAQRAAAGQGWHTAVWRLAWSLGTFHRRLGHWQDEVTVWRTGVSAADHLGDPTTQSLAHRLLGIALARLGQHDEALGYLRRALTLAEFTDDLSGRAHTHHALAGAWERQGEDRRAWEHARDALRLFQAADQPVWEADTLNAVGWYAIRLGDHDQARTHCRAALELCRRHGFREVEAGTLDTLGYLAHHTGRHAEAVSYYQRALILFRDLGTPFYEADTLDHLGSAHAAAGRPDQARAAWSQALKLYRTQHRTQYLNRVQRQLDALDERPAP